MNTINFTLVFAKHFIIIGCCTALQSKVHSEELAVPVPEEQNLQPGDLLWPKRPNTLVLYGSGNILDTVKLRENWEAEKKLFLQKLTSGSGELNRERYNTIQPMQYDSFTSYYFANQSSGQQIDYGTGGVAVGHVAIVRIIEGKCYIVEALLKDGVRETDYASWLKERSGELVWHGRVKGITLDQRNSIAEFAAKQVGKPYDFWNFDLDDETGFYCSKLAWLSILNGSGIVADDNKDSNRIIWYSPKQLLGSRHLDLLMNPGDYGRRIVDQTVGE